MIEKLIGDVYLTGSDFENLSSQHLPEFIYSSKMNIQRPLTQLDEAYLSVMIMVLYHATYKTNKKEFFDYFNKNIELMEKIIAYKISNNHNGINQFFSWPIEKCLEEAGFPFISIQAHMADRNFMNLITYLKPYHYEKFRNEIEWYFFNK